MKAILLTLAAIFLVFVVSAQKEVDQDWNAFAKTIDVTAYQRGNFIFKGYVRAENAAGESSARLWARVDKKKGIGFFDNMQNRPVSSPTWKEYTIEGDIDKDAVKLIIGGLFLGGGKYYFDKFSLQLQKPGGEWENIALPNHSFEDESFATDWKCFYVVKGYEVKLIPETSVEGQKCLMADGSERSKLSKYVEANGINIHYQEHGKGDTLLLLHGNSESLKSFQHQIPELSKSFYVIAMDSRGQGNTSKDEKPMSYELMMEDVNQFLEKLNLRNINILGWSDGGNIGLLLAMKHPDKVKKLAIMGANLYNDKTTVEEKINKQLLDQKKRLLTQEGPKNKFALEMIDLLLYQPNIKPEDLGSIKCPTLVMAGSKDAIKGEHTKLIARSIPSSQLVIFDRGTHYEPMENPKRFNKTVLEFFKQ